MVLIKISCGTSVTLQGLVNFFIDRHEKRLFLFSFGVLRAFSKKLQIAHLFAHFFPKSVSLDDRLELLIRVDRAIRLQAADVGTLRALL